MRFDAPGDFQLCLREDFVAIDGFDEAMVLGWHVDSNLSRRMFLRRGSIGSLEDSSRGLPLQPQPDTDRLPRRRRASRTTSFVTAPPFERAELPAQRETWGLANVALEEIAVGPATGARFTVALESAMPAAREA